MPDDKWGKVNVFEIDDESVSKLKDHLLKASYKVANTKSITLNDEMFTIDVFYDFYTNPQSVSWAWFVNFFATKQNGLSEYTKTISNPKFVFFIKGNKSRFNYALTFGSSYLTVDTFSNIEFSLQIAERLKLLNIKTETLFNPSSTMPKSIHSYNNIDELDFEDISAFVKIKADISAPSPFTKCAPTVEFGHSIRVTINNSSINNVLEFLKQLEEVYARDIIQNEIPFIRKVASSNESRKLTEKMFSELSDADNRETVFFGIPQISTKGVNDLFFDDYDDSHLTISYGKDIKETSSTS